MTIARTPKGTQADKTGALTMTIAAVTVAERGSLLVEVGYLQGNGAPVVTWGERTLIRRTVQQANGIGVAQYSMYRSQGADTRDIVATWKNTAPNAKAMVAFEVMGIRRKDFESTNSQANTVNCSTGALQTPSQAETFASGAHASLGPVEDTAGIPSLGFTAGQRAGTTGGTPESNVTIQSNFRILDTAVDIRSRMAGATSRAFSSTLCVYKATYTVTVDSRVVVDDVAEVSQAAADTKIENDVLTRFPKNWTVTILP